MNVISLSNLKKEEKIKGLVANKIPSESKAQFVNLIFESGKNLPIHTTPVDVVFYVIKGSGTLIIGEEERVVQEGDFINSPANIPHGWKNTSNDTLAILVIKLYS